MLDVDTMDDKRDMRLEILERFYRTQCQVERIDDGHLVFRVDFRHQDAVYVGTSSANIWKLQDCETTFVFSGESLDSDTYRADMDRAIEDAGDALTPHRKLRSAVLTVVMIYDSAEPDVLEQIRTHDYKIYHKYSLNGWTIHRIVLVLTGSEEIVTDKRGENLERRFRNILTF